MNIGNRTASAQTEARDLPPITDDKVRAFLSDTLDLWRVDGTIEAGEAPVVAVIHTRAATVWIERADDGTPFRWLARSRPAGEPPGCARE
ncbi:MAG TPA: hypothetical protein VGP15_02415, partial [Burkholderiales bacterium]|nr:hypothetical protein [Burkholderiales bacterium]